MRLLTARSDTASGRGGAPFGKQYAPLPFRMHIGNGGRCHAGVGAMTTFPGWSNLKEQQGIWMEWVARQEMKIEQGDGR